MRVTLWIISLMALSMMLQSSSMALEPIPDRTVVLTFDDNVRSHLNFVAPLLKEKGFGATFFVTHKWMDDPENFLNWEEIAKLDQMGFEIGNHSWTHPGFNTPRNVAHLESELSLVDRELSRVKIEKPITFAWTGNAFSPEARKVLQDHGILFARRGMQPEVPYGELNLGPLYDPAKHDPLLIPSAGDAYPNLTLDHFVSVVERAKDGKIAVCQFHGVPDPVHPWVSTDPDLFRDCMQYLADNHFNVIALGDLKKYVDPMNPPEDPLIQERYRDVPATDLPLPPEQIGTRARLRNWTENMLQWHGYSNAEAAGVAGLSEPQFKREVDNLAWSLEENSLKIEGKILALPYPGGRHPRIGFLDGAISPMRGTKVSLFPPWDDGGYVVLDLPEAIFSNLGLTFLAHTHIPTIWDESGTWIENVDWIQHLDGSLEFEWELPNKIRFGSRVIPDATGAECEMWLTNGTSEPLTGLRTQVCAMLKGVPGFNEQSGDKKRLDSPVAAIHSEDNKRWILKAFDHCGRVWENPRCPCMHSDPVFPDTQPGETVRVHGRVWFYEGDQIDQEIEKAKARFGG